MHEPVADRRGRHTHLHQHRKNDRTCGRRIECGACQGSNHQRTQRSIKVGAEWTVSLEDNGQSEMYFQDLIVGPGGYTGWHSHPGLLLITIKEGRVDFYNKDCVKTVYMAGQSFTEGAEPHAVVNTGSVNARLLVAYIIKSGESRRIERSQPKCGEALRIP